jgi:hypothetical protein
MTVYYRGPTALVTERSLEVWAPVHRRYLVADLRALHVVRVESDRLAVGTARVAGVCAVVALVSLPFVDSPVGWLLIGSFLLVPGFMTAACWRFSRPLYALHATYRGTPVRLFASRDPRLFGQVRRGLLRAVEAHRKVWQLNLGRPLKV